MERATYTMTAQKRGSASVGLGDSVSAVAVLSVALVAAAAPVVVLSAIAGAASAVAVQRIGRRLWAPRQREGRRRRRRPGSRAAD